MRPVEVIVLARRDSIDTACELLLSATPGAQVWVVCPWRVGPLSTQFDLVRLRRVADTAAVDLHLAGGHPRIRALARRAGILTHSGLPWHLWRYRNRRPRSGRRLSSHTVSTKGLRAHRHRVPRFLAFLSTFVLALALLAITVAAIATLFPSASVVLDLRTQASSASFDVVADPRHSEIDYEKAIVPGHTVEVSVEISDRIPSTGYRDVEVGYASGDIVFANRTDSVVTVPKGTVVRTSSGINARFHTVTDLELPAALYSHARMGVIALEKGPSHNVAPLTINIVEGDVAGAVDVLNPEATRGGTTRRVGIVKRPDPDRGIPSDLNVLYEGLTKQLTRAASDQLALQLAENEFMPPATVRVRIESVEFFPDQVLGATSDIVSGNMQAIATGTAIDDRDVTEYASWILARRAQEGWALAQPGVEARRILDSYKAPPVDSDDWSSGVITFTVAVRGSVAQAVNTDGVKRTIRGQPAQQAEEWLNENYELRSPARVIVTPRWWPRVPLLPGRIDVTLDTDGA